MFSFRIAYEYRYEYSIMKTCIPNDICMKIKSRLYSIIEQFRLK